MRELARYVLEYERAFWLLALDESTEQWLERPNNPGSNLTRSNPGGGMLTGGLRAKHIIRSEYVLVAAGEGRGWVPFRDVVSVDGKEQRFPDIASFRTDPDPASSDDLLILHGQEFHTSSWGHMGLLNLAEHLLLPGYASYPFTAVASPYPHNTAVADMARRQQGLVGYVHPFDVDVDPAADATLTNALPVGAALGKVDYYEAVGFSDHKATNAIWYRLLDCGLRIPAGAGTDAMANYASLRGPVGLNRVYVPATGALTREAFLAQVKQGRGTATNGAFLQLDVAGASPGDTIRLAEGSHSLAYRAVLTANFPADHLEIVFNGKVVASLEPRNDRLSADIKGTLTVDESGWLLLRAWNDGPHPDVLDIYPWATTSPIYVEVGNQTRRSRQAASYFVRWIDRLRAVTEKNVDYRSASERDAVLSDLERARAFYAQIVNRIEGER